MAEPPTPPKNQTDFDLTLPPRQSDNPPIVRRGKPGGITSPAQQMRDLGFCPDKNMNPLQFLIAVMNEDVDALYKQKKKREMMRGKGIGLNYRIDCAKTAAKFMHMAMPSIQINKDEGGTFGENLSKAIVQGNKRVQTRRIILETVEEISPDMPLEDAMYPPVFQEGIVGRIIDDDQALADDILGIDPEGDMEYDPDRDD